MSRGDVAIRIDLCKIPFENSYFDLIICNHVLEHIDDDLKAIREMHRVLASHGHAIVTIPQDPSRSQTYEDKKITSAEDRALAFGQADHVRIYGKDFSDRLKSSGFAVNSIRAQDLAPQQELTRLGLTAASGNIYVCQKRL